MWLYNLQKKKHTKNIIITIIKNDEKKLIINIIKYEFYENRFFFFKVLVTNPIDILMTPNLPRILVPLSTTTLCLR